MEYYTDILEPSKDLNTAVDQLGTKIGDLYREAWDKHMKANYSDKPFSLNATVFVNMWLSGVIKLFIVYNKADNSPVGFLVGMTFRPMPYEANVFQIEDWYVREEHKDAERCLLDHVVNAIRYMSCDEIWTPGDNSGNAPDLGMKWKKTNTFSRHRYIKNE